MYEWLFGDQRVLEYSEVNNEVVPFHSIGIFNEQMVCDIYIYSARMCDVSM